MKTSLRLLLLFIAVALSPLSIFCQHPPEHNSTHSIPNDRTSEGLPEDYGIESGIRDDNFHNMQEEPHVHETDSFQSKFLYMLFLLALLIGFMIVASWALKRMMRSKVSVMNNSGMIKILETRYLSPRATLYLIEVEDQTFLISESPTQVTSLALFSSEKYAKTQEN